MTTANDLDTGQIQEAAELMQTLFQSTEAFASSAPQRPECLPCPQGQVIGAQLLAEQLSG